MPHQSILKMVHAHANILKQHKCPWPTKQEIKGLLVYNFPYLSIQTRN